MEKFISLDRFEPLRRKLEATLARSGGFRVGSMCSGWGVLEMVMNCFEARWNVARDERSFLKACCWAKLGAMTSLT